MATRANVRPLTITWYRSVVRVAVARVPAAANWCQASLRPVQIWVPDVTAEGFAAEAHRQSRAVAASEAADNDQAFGDAVSDWPGE